MLQCELFGSEGGEAKSVTAAELPSRKTALSPPAAAACHSTYLLTLFMKEHQVGPDMILMGLGMFCQSTLWTERMERFYKPGNYDTGDVNSGRRIHKSHIYIAKLSGSQIKS